MTNELEFRVQKNGVEKTVTGSEFRACAVMCGIKSSGLFVSFFGKDKDGNSFLGYITKMAPYILKAEDANEKED